MSFSVVMTDQVRCDFGEFRRAGALVMHPIVEHIAVTTLAPELDWNQIIHAWPHVLQVAFRVLPDVLWDAHRLLIRLVSVSGHTAQLGDFNTLFTLGHKVQINAIVDEWMFSCIDHLHVKSHAHVRLTEPRIDFLPVQVLLIDNGFDSLWKNAILE